MSATRVLLIVPLALLAFTSPVRGEVNCEQVRRYAKTGRTVEDIAETMIIDVATVKKCLEGGDTAPAATPAAK